MSHCKRNGAWVAVVVVLIFVGQADAKSVRWYRPVDIGYHVVNEDVSRKSLSEASLREYFGDSGLSQAGTLHFRGLYQQRLSWISDWIKKESARQRNLRRIKQVKFDLHVRRFSKKHVTVWVTSKIAFSRWHSFYVVLAKYQLKRSPFVNQVFNLRALDAKYVPEFLGIGNGTSVAELSARIGSDFEEYRGTIS